MADLSVRFVGSQADIPEALWQRCFSPSLEGRWWYQTLEASGLEDQFKFLYAVVYDGATPLGIAPAFTMRLPVGMVLPPALAFLGRWFPGVFHPLALVVGSPCSDEGTVGLLPGVSRAEALLCLQDAFEARTRDEGAAMLVWKDFPAADDEAFAQVMGQRRLLRMTSFPGTTVDLPPGGKDAYFQALKGGQRRNLKRKLRRSAEAVEIAVEMIQKPTARTLDEVFALFQQSYERASTQFERLDRRFFAAIAAQPVAHFVILREHKSGDMLAFMLGFDLSDQKGGGGRVIHKYLGIDYRRPQEWGIYFRLWEAIVDWALTRGATSIQSGQTGYGGKIDTGHRLVPLTVYARHRNPVVHAILRAIARMVSWKTLDDDLADFLKRLPTSGADN
jgi:hypothetical protein